MSRSAVLPDARGWENPEQSRPGEIHQERPHAWEPGQVSAEAVAGRRENWRPSWAAERMELPAEVWLVREPGADVRSPQREVAGDEARDLSEVAVSEPARSREAAGPGVRPVLPAMALQVHPPNAMEAPECLSVQQLRWQMWLRELRALAAVQALLEPEQPERDGSCLRQEVAAAAEIAWEDVLLLPTVQA